MKTYWHRRASISIGTVSTLEPGASATASVTEDNVLSLGIPQGERGIQGPPMDYDDLTAEQKQALAEDMMEYYAMPKASASTLGGIKVGTGLSADADGVLSATGVASPEMTGANGTTAGTGGTVPAPVATDNVKFLRGDATWAVPTDTTYSNATTEAAGLMSAADKVKLNGVATGATKGKRDFLASLNGANNVVLDDLDDYDILLIKYAPLGAGPAWHTCWLDATEITTTREQAYALAEAASYAAGSYQAAITSGYLTAIAEKSNKVGCRNYTLYYRVTFDASHNATEEIVLTYADAYYNGAKNNMYCYPSAAYGVKL